MDRKLFHSSLGATLKGKEVENNGTKIVHYRGIQYGKIPRRFAKSELADDYSDEVVDCTRFGPICPQNYVDASYLLRVPETLCKGQAEIPQDEFLCLNINLSVPADVLNTRKLLPVLIWIHGGSQVFSFPPAAHKSCDTTPLISQSIASGKPIIIVTFNYRVNIFGFGDGTVRNLALKDQQLAIEWVTKHIGAFGGDKDNITLGGESAGAIYTHAHLITKAPVHRFILQSGSLHTNPLQPPELGNTLISNLSRKLGQEHGLSLSDAPTSALLRVLEESKVSVWIQQEPGLTSWEGILNEEKEILIGDVEYESIIYRNGIEAMSAEEITSTLDSEPEFGPRLKHLYGVSSSRPSSTKIGALDLINDSKFAMPANDLAHARRLAGHTTYQYIIDQANPWQISNRAHHCVDLIFLFGAYDLSFNPPADVVGRQIREKWIEFINGREPWEKDKRFAFGPLGKCGEIDDSEYVARRRVMHFEVLRKMGAKRVNDIVGKLVVGRASLLN